MNYQEINLNKQNNPSKQQGCLGKRRISLERFRKALGRTGIGKTDEEIMIIMNLQYKLAGVLYKSWVRSR